MVTAKYIVFFIDEVQYLPVEFIPMGERGNGSDREALIGPAKSQKVLFSNNAVNVLCEEAKG
jgi:hypothetical protein